ncbi:BglG family transcription antiterminator [Levilactobacillus namurensis]|uniref:BglG family transcription antiterminator n=1 Tax=Levilactobacillus namurensis TaxID=380393 RepID=UPI00223111AB|nr:PRD domain-containing protein [Levilactobacillus namurensis]MCW3779216.1 PRD domain-containing protein [Levilactobacillus namurensis]MDT7019959.1 PRD domain-containing protein [Levilactobacillus namurensis]WNN65463.1 PRD domain-containing protein [Levilactobacillus namurensis]
MVKADVNRELVNLLYQQDSYITASKLSIQLNVSPKTVYRAINQINDRVGKPKLIVTAKGKGVEINRQRTMTDEVPYSNVVDISNGDGFSPSKRRKQIMLRLLYMSPQGMDVRSLYKNFYVSDSVINNDEKVIGTWLERYGLRMHRSHWKLAIVGEELVVRRAISVLTDLTGIIDFNNIFKFSKVALNQMDVNFVIDLIRDAEKDLRIEIPYPYDINLFSHVYILINRYRNVGNRGFIGVHPVAESKMPNRKLLECTQIMGRRIEKYAHIKLPATEITYIYEYLNASRITGDDQRADILPQRAIQVAQDYVYMVGEILHMTIHADDIIEDLSNHIRPMLNRLANGIQAKNELLDQVKREYPQILDAVVQASKKISVKYQLENISLDESAFIAIYIARVVEQTKRPLHIVIACTTGIGTAELIRVKVHKTLPNLVVDDVISLNQYMTNRQKYRDIDFIISTIPLKAERDVPVIVVSALFSQRDQNAIRKIINQLSGGAAWKK